MGAGERDLPESVRELIQLIGQEAALKLVDKYGGAHFWTPDPGAIDPESCELVGLIGIQRTRALAARYGRTMVVVPRCVEWKRVVRNQLIRADQKAGMSGAQIALKYQISRRQVVNILGSTP